MSETTLEKANREGVDERMLNHSYAAAMLLTAKRMNEREYPAELIDALCQKWEGGGRFNIYDADKFLLVVDHIVRGNILFRQLPLESGPFADRMIEENNEALSKLPEGARAAFVPGTQRDDDGQVTISVPIRFRRMRTREKEEEVVVIDDENSPLLWPLSFPLEVGTCPSWRSWFHLIRNGALARWPYGHKMLHLFCIAPGRWDEVRPRLL